MVGATDFSKLRDACRNIKKRRGSVKAWMFHYDTNEAIPHVPIRNCQSALSRVRPGAREGQFPLKMDCLRF